MRVYTAEVPLVLRDSVDFIIIAIVYSMCHYSETGNVQMPNQALLLRYFVGRCGVSAMDQFGCLCYGPVWVSPLWTSLGVSAMDQFGCLRYGPVWVSLLWTSLGVSAMDQFGHSAQASGECSTAIVLPH